MADFVQNINIKSAVRKLANPIADIDTFNAIVQSVILNNPFVCVSYMSSGVNQPDEHLGSDGCRKHPISRTGFRIINSFPRSRAPAGLRAHRPCPAG